MNSRALASATASPCGPPRYHQSQPTNANETATQMADQMDASLIETLCAPCLFIAKKSTSKAMRTNAANSVQRIGVPMVINGGFLDWVPAPLAWAD